MKQPDMQIIERLKVKCFCGLWVIAGHHGPNLETDPADFLKALRLRCSP